MPFAEKQLKLEIIVVNEISKNQKDKCFHVQNLIFLRLIRAMKVELGLREGAA